MHIIRVYAKSGGMVCQFSGIDAEKHLAESPYKDDRNFIILN